MELRRHKKIESTIAKPGEPNQTCPLGCKAQVPRALHAEGFCIVHFTLHVEEACAELRRETAVSKASPARQAEIADYVSTAAVKLAHAANGISPVPDEIKKRILATFLTLMNLRENLNRAEGRFVPPLQPSASLGDNSNGRGTRPAAARLN